MNLKVRNAFATLFVWKFTLHLANDVDEDTKQFKGIAAAFVAALQDIRDEAMSELLQNFVDTHLDEEAGSSKLSELYETMKAKVKAKGLFGKSED